MSTGAAAAAAAAAEMQRRQEEEEQEMTSYSPQELADGWEFKILRSNWTTFRDPEKLRAILEEERRGGWVLVEKFDDQRIRLKRPAGAKEVEGDFADGYDPYRTTVGDPSGRRVVVALAIAFLMLTVGLILTVFLIK